MKRIFQSLIYLPALLPLYSLKMVSIAIILFVLSAIYTCDYKKWSKTTLKNSIRKAFPFSILFFLYLASLLWTDNQERGMLYVEHTFSFLLFPFTIFVFRPFSSNTEIQLFIKIFIVSTGLLALFTLLYLGIEIYKNYENINKIESFLRQRIDKTYVIGEHPIYFSLLLAAGLLLSHYFTFKNRLLVISIIVLNLIGILIAASRGVFFALVIAHIVAIYLRIKRKKIAIIVVLSFILIAFAIVMVTPLKNRMKQFKQLANSEQIYPKGIYHNSFNIRMAVYKCSFGLIQHNPLIGHGAGDIEKELEKCYKTFETNAFENHIYNTHNQYLHYLCAFGIIGTIIIIYCFVIYIKKAWLFGETAYVLLLLLFYISFLTENILVRNTGIVLFSMLNTIFAFQILLKDEKYDTPLLDST